MEQIRIPVILLHSLLKISIQNFMRSFTESFLKQKRNQKSSSPYCSCGLNLLLRCQICQRCILHRFKVTVYLQGCLAYKRCSVSSLIKLQMYQIKAYRTGYQIIPTNLKRNELPNFSRLLNTSARISFRNGIIEKIFRMKKFADIFLLFMC